MNLFSLFAEIGLDDSKYKKGIAGATESGKKFASNIASSVSAGTIALGNLMSSAITKAGQSIMEFGTKGFEYNRTMEDYVTNFRTLLGGSTEAAEQMTGALEDMAAKTPFAMEDLASSTQTLLSFGVESEDVLGIMGMLGDVAMGNGEKFASLSRAFGQISAAGKLTGEDLNQLIDQGFNPLQTIADETGVSMSDLKAVMSGQKTSRDFKEALRDARKEVKKLGDNASDGAKWLVQMGEDGAISADIVTDVFEKVTSEGGLFAGAMEAASQTTSGMLATLEDNWTALLGSVFKPASDFLQTTLLPGAISAVDTLQTAYNEGGLSGMLAAVGQMAVDLGTQLVTAITDAGPKILEALPGIVTSVTTWITEKKTELSTAATTFFAGVEESIPGLIEKLNLALPGILTAITTWLIGSKITLGENVVTLFGAFTDAIPTIATTISENLPTIITTITDYLVTQGPVMLEKALGLFGEIANAIPGVITSLTVALPTLVTSIIDTLVLEGPRLLTLGSDLLVQLITGLGTITGDALAQIIVAASNLITSLGTKLKEYDWSQICTDLITGLVNGLSAAATASMESIKSVFSGIWTGIKEVLGIHSPSTLAAEAGSYIVEGFANGVTTGEQTFGEKIKGVFTSIWEGIKSIFGFGKGKGKETTEEDASAVGMSVVEGLATGLGGDENSAVTNATSLAERILEALRTGLDIVEGVSNNAVTIGATVTSGVNQGAVDAEITGMQTISDNIFSEFVTAMTIVMGVAQKYVPIGKAIAEGVAKGIKDNANLITQAVKDAASDAYTTAMDAIDAHSPSRKMMQVGKYWAEGYAIGISSNSGLIAGAARNASNQAVYGSYMGDINVTQNIAAVAMSENELAIQTANALQLLRFA